MRGTLIAGLALAFAVGNIGRAADVEAKIGCVDMERVLAAHPEAKQAEALLEKQIQEFEAERDAMRTKLKNMEKQVLQAREEAENKALSDAGREKKKQEAEDKLIALQDYSTEAQQTSALRQRQLAERRKRMRERVVEQIRTVVETYAVQKGLALVVDSGPILDSPGTVVYSLKKMDITEDILKIIAASNAGREGASDEGKDLPAASKEKAKVAPPAAPDAKAIKP